MTTDDFITIGVDPGSRYTGIAAIVANRTDHAGRRPLLDAEVLTHPPGPLLDAVRIAQACAEVLEAVDRHLVAGLIAARPDPFDHPNVSPGTLADGAAAHLEAGTLLLAVEGLAAPKGFSRGRREPIDPQGIIGAGVVLGAVLGRWPAAVIIDPGGNGSSAGDAYPEQLRKGARLGGPSDHARSAYDVALRGRPTAAIRAAEAAKLTRATPPR